MLFYGLEPYFWLKALLLVAVIALLLFLFTSIIRKILVLKRKKFFSNPHVNVLHKKIDWTIRIIIITLMIIGGLINISRQPLAPVLVLQPYVLLFILVYVTEIVTAIMQMKYIKNKNESIFTIARLGFISLLLVTVYATDFFV